MVWMIVIADGTVATVARPVALDAVEALLNDGDTSVRHYSRGAALGAIKFGQWEELAAFVGVDLEALDCFLDAAWDGDRQVFLDGCVAALERGLEHLELPLRFKTAPAERAHVDIAAIPDEIVVTLYR